VRYGTVCSQAAQAAGIDPRFLLGLWPKSRIPLRRGGDVSAGGRRPCCKLIAGHAARLEQAAEHEQPAAANSPFNCPAGSALSAETVAPRVAGQSLFLAIASLQRPVPGPCRGAGLSPSLQTEPELWVEAIPFPRPGITQKVLGNLWTYQQFDAACACAAP